MEFYCSMCDGCSLVLVQYEGSLLGDPPARIALFFFFKSFILKLQMIEIYQYGGELVLAGDSKW